MFGRQKFISLDEEYNGEPFSGKEKYQRVVAGGDTYFVLARQLSQVADGRRKAPSIAYKVTGITGQGFITEKSRDKETRRAIASTWREVQSILERTCPSLIVFQ